MRSAAETTGIKTVVDLACHMPWRIGLCHREYTPDRHHDLSEIRANAHGTLYGS